MTNFEMIKYHGLCYPADIPLRIEEIAAHFDVQYVKAYLGYSLHTEYSYGKRNFNTALIESFPEITASNKDGIPQLWKSEPWALEFSDFIRKLVSGKPAPKIIEIHPPFNDYTDIASFVRIYSVFENRIKEYFPDTEILIENRCGSVYHGGKFILSKTPDIFRLAELVYAKSLNLKMAYDIPQIYTAYNAKNDLQFIKPLQDIKNVRQFIGGVHLWGKRVSERGRKVAHCGDLDSYFENADTKKIFLQAFVECFDDDIARKMVLEVNSGNADLLSIISDLRNVGVKFV